MHINRSEEVEWIRDRIENGWASFNPSATERRQILDKLVAADGWKNSLVNTLVKSASREGGDSLIPMLDAIVNRSVEQGSKKLLSVWPTAAVSMC